MHTALTISTRTHALTAALAALGVSCGPAGPGPNGEPPNVPGTNRWIDAGDGLDHGLMTTLELSAPGDIELPKTTTATLAVEGVFEDGTTVDMTEEVEWRTDQPAVLELAAMETPVTIRGLVQGTAQVIADIGDLRAQRLVTVGAAPLVGLEVAPSGPILVGQATPLQATARYADDTTRDVTAEASWSSSQPDIVAVLDDAGRKGLAYALGRGPFTVTASFEDQAAAADLEVACRLQPSNAVAFGEILPNASWANTIQYDEGGQRTERPLSIEDLMCDPSFNAYRGFVFSVNAGWCRPCHAWMQYAADNEATFAEEGILPVFVIGDTAQPGSYDGADLAYADRLTRTHAGDAMSLRVGDADTMGAGSIGMKQILSVTNAWPTLFLVDRENMRVVTRVQRALDQPGQGYPSIRDALAMLGQGGGGPPVMSNCSADADEASEPNDIPAIAASVGEGELAAGMCDGDPDFFRVEIEGRWRATIMFSNRTADLDLFGWDEAENAILRENGQAIASATRNDTESIELTGPALIRIQAKGQATGDYTLLIERL